MKKNQLQKFLNVMEMKYTIFNEISQIQKDHILLTICGNLKEVGLKVEEEFTGIEKGRVPEGRKQKKWA